MSGCGQWARSLLGVVRRTKRREIYVVSTTQRPVPLQHHLYTGNSKQTQDQLFMIVGEEKKFIVTGYEDNDDMGLAVFHLLSLSPSVIKLL